MMKRSLSLRLSRKDFGGKNNMETFGATITIIHLVMTAITMKDVTLHDATWFEQLVKVLRKSTCKSSPYIANQLCG